MTKGKRMDMWIVVVSEEGVHNPLHAFGKSGVDYLCDEEAQVEHGKVVRTPLTESVRIPKADVVFTDIDINALPDMLTISRRWYAATVEHATGLAAALEKTRPGETQLREKIRMQFRERLNEQRAVLLRQAEEILKPKVVAD